MWQLLTLKHAGKAGRGLLFHSEGKNTVCVCVRKFEQWVYQACDYILTMPLCLLWDTSNVFIIQRWKTRSINNALIAILSHSHIIGVLSCIQYILSKSVLMWLLRSLEDTATICTCECSWCSTSHTQYPEINNEQNIQRSMSIVVVFHVCGKKKT